jgi:hypothetical protein
VEIRITKQQIKFWTAIEDIINTDPDHYISKLVKIGETTDYIKYYKNLINTYSDTKICNDTMKNNYQNTMREKIEKAAREDTDSKLGTYFMINPELETPKYDMKFEFQRVQVTRYRTGSHNLRIEKDRRYPNSKREDRTCTCNMGVQSIKHVCIDCPLLQEIRDKYGIDSIQKGVSNDDFLMEMECVLNIRK